jgi:hypothetical protein
MTLPKPEEAPPAGALTHLTGDGCLKTAERLSKMGWQAHWPHSSAKPTKPELLKEYVPDYFEYSLPARLELAAANPALLLDLPAAADAAAVKAASAAFGEVSHPPPGPARPRRALRQAACAARARQTRSATRRRRALRAGRPHSTGQPPQPLACRERSPCWPPARQVREVLRPAGTSFAFVHFANDAAAARCVAELRSVSGAAVRAQPAKRQAAEVAAWRAGLARGGRKTPSPDGSWEMVQPAAA